MLTWYYKYILVIFSPILVKFHRLLRRKMTAAKDTYSNLQKENRNMIKIPEYNYRQGERKTMLYNGSGWYIPCERRWESYDQHHELPRLARPDAIEFESEKQFVNFLKRRDVPKCESFQSANLFTFREKNNSAYTVWSTLP